MRSLKGKMVKVTIKPQNISVDVSKGTLLIEAIRKAIPWFPSPCGGLGICGKCKVRIIKGELSKPTSNEKLLNILHEGFRLACQTTVFDDTIVEIPYREPIAFPTISTIEIKVPIKPWVSWRTFEASKYSKPFDKFVLEEVGARYLSYVAARELVNVKLNGKATIMAYGESVYRVDTYHFEPLGLAVDIGTTKIAEYLIDLSTGTTLNEGFTLNPQLKYGDDIVSRMTVALMDKRKLYDMRSITLKSIEDLAKKLALEVKKPVTNITAISIVGNTAMHHILLGLDLSDIAFAPYIPKESSPIIEYGGNLGFKILRRTMVYIAPVISGYVGGDAVATLLTIHYLNPKLPSLVIDVGTTAEIGLFLKDKIVVASAPAGPAIEGHVTSGLKGVQGSIYDVEAEKVGDNVRFNIKVLGEMEPSGISGSGAVSIVSELLRIGAITATGKLKIGNYDERGVRYVEIADSKEPIVFTQTDIREIQKAKSAIQTTWQLMLEDEGLSEDDLESVFIAGTFGSYLKPVHAQRIGLIPKVDLDKVFIIGNAAGAGAKLMLINGEARRKGEEIALKAEHRVYASTDRFRRLWIKNLNFK